uniref:F-box domain-containing protein n=1 Tax=Ascaris lumbricoides TaxID=6252 RepID=A0A0M3IB58_ASCLU
MKMRGRGFEMLCGNSFLGSVSGSASFEWSERSASSFRSDAFTLLEQYPISELSSRIWRYASRRVYGQVRHIPASQLNLDATKKICNGDELPDVIFRTIFKYLHPLDLIHGCSKVCQRWNRFTRTPSLYRYLRIFVRKESLDCGSIRRFLERVRNHVVKLCVVYSSPELVNALHAVFPDCMPNVMHLDIGSFEHVPPILAKKILNCFPSLETLKVAMVSRRMASQEQLMWIFADSAFPRLRRLVLSYVDEFSTNISNSLFSWNRSLEVLVFRNAVSPRFHYLSNASYSLTLKELHLEIVDASDALAINKFKNLTTLSLGCCWQLSDDHLNRFKELYKIEHLHLSSLGGDVSMTGLANFLRLPAHDAHHFFPYRLKYLRISHCEQFALEAVKRLIQSCPNLESLNIAGDSQIGSAELCLIIANLRKLRFFDLSYLDDSIGDYGDEWALQNLRDNELACVRLLQLHSTHQQNDETMLRAVNMKRPHMLISPRPNYLINWKLIGECTVFNEEFEGDLNAVLNDLNDEPGFCCIDDYHALGRQN